MAVAWTESFVHATATFSLEKSMSTIWRNRIDAENPKNKFFGERLRNSGKNEWGRKIFEKLDIILIKSCSENEKCEKNSRILWFENVIQTWDALEKG